MAEQNYELDGPTDFFFPYPVRTAGQIIVSVVPGGVLPQSSYQIIGASSTATGVTIRWEGAPRDGSATLNVQRRTEPQRVSNFLSDLSITATALNGEFNNILQLVEDGFDIDQQVADAQSAADTAQAAETQSLVNAGVAQAAQIAAEEAAEEAEGSLEAVLGQKVIWTGAYNALTNYEPQDAFSFGGASYIVTASVVGVEPPDNAYYDVLAAQGTPGAGTGDMVAANNLSDVANASTARTNLGLQIGVNVQAFDADTAKLDQNANFTGTLQKSGVNVLLANAIGTSVQAYNINIPTVNATTAEMEAGTQTARRSMSPANVKSAIDAATPEYTPPTTLNAVHTYRFRVSPTTFTVGTTYAGSTLGFSVGTWRCMGGGQTGRVTSGTTLINQYGYIFLRIA